MEELLNNLNSINNSFEIMSQYIQTKEILQLTKDFLNNINLKTKSQEFLALWMIYKFPKDVMGSNYDELLYQDCCDIFDHKNLNLIMKAINAFKQWKIKDIEILKNNMFFEYHNLGIALLNASTQSKESLKKCRESILYQAEKIGGSAFVTKIKEYKPVVFNLHDLEKISEQAFWDMVEEEFKAQKYDWIYVILEHIRTLFTTLSPQNSEYYTEIIDIPFIKQQVEHNVYTDVQNLSYKLLDILKSLHAPINDAELTHLKASPFNLIKILHELVQRSENVLMTVLNLSP